MAAAQKNRKFGLKFMIFLVLAPLVGFPLAGLLIDEMPLGEALIIGVGVSLVMLIFNLFAQRRSRAPTWEGRVVNKYSKRRSRHRDDAGTYMEYTVVITTDGGKKRTIVEEGGRRYMYDYLSPGDRVRYHPVFDTYEKYDKSRDRVIYCNVCTMMNSINNDRCKRCNSLLFK